MLLTRDEWRPETLLSDAQGTAPARTALVGRHARSRHLVAPRDNAAASGEAKTQNRSLQGSCDDKYQWWQRSRFAPGCSRCAGLMRGVSCGETQAPPPR